MIRVLQVIGSLNAGGAQAMIINLYKHMDRSKVQFDFMIFHNEQRMLEQEIAELGGKVFYIEAFNGKNLFQFIKAWKIFLKDHPEYRIVHGHVRGSAAIYLLVAKTMGRITIVHSHSVSNGHDMKAIVKKIMQFPLRYTVDYLFACSDEAGRWLYGKNVSLRNNYRVMANTIDAEKFAFDMSKREKVREQLGIDDEDFVIGHVGRFVEPKNHSFLVKIFYLVKQKREKVKLLLVGDGELKGEIEKEVKKLGLSNSVIFTGTKTNTEDFYHAMDLFVFPSLWEGLGLVVLEAQANGLQCLVSDRVPHEVENSEGVQFIPLEDISRWKCEIEKCRGRSKKVQFDRERYDIKKATFEMLEFYQKIGGSKNQKNAGKVGS